MSTDYEQTSIDTRHIVYNSSAPASKGRMNLQRQAEPENLRTVEALPVSTIIRVEPVHERTPIAKQVVLVDLEKEAQAANIEAPATSNKAISEEASSETSYDSKEEKQSPKIQEVQKPAVAANVNRESEPIGVVEVQGFGGKDHYLSEGHVVFKILEARFRPNSKVNANNKPYFKFRLGLNSKKTKTVTVEGKSVKVAEEIKVKYSNQDQVRIKVKGKGLIMDNVLASTKVSVVDVVMEGKKTVWAPLLKGDNVVGEIKLEMEFAPKM